MSNATVSKVSDSFGLTITLPEVIRGASVITTLSPKGAVDLATGAKSTAESRGHGLASTLAMLAFGTISYRSNPYEGSKTKYGKALASAFGAFPHLKIKHGGSMTSADFIQWFGICADLAHKALPAPKVTKTVTAPTTITTAEQDNVLSPDQVREASLLLIQNMDNHAVDRFERAMIAREEVQEKARQEEATRQANLARLQQEAIARYAQRNGDNRARALAFAELANTLGIKLTAGQLKTLDAIEKIAA